MAILEPELAILDETDSGLDIDALRIVATGIREVQRRPRRARRRADHPLPASARRAAPRPRAHPDRRPHRRVRRHGAGRAARSETATSRSDRCRHEHRHARHRRDQADFPMLSTHDRRPADRVPRFGQHVAEAAPGHRCDDALHGALVRADQPQRLPAGRRGHRPLRGRAPQGRSASSTRRRRTSSSSPRTRPRRSTWSSGRGAAPTSARATSSCSPTWSTTPTSCPGTCSPPSAASSCAGCR